jgi:hypothetical protein
MGKIRDAELEKSKQRQALDAGEEVRGRPAGAHPGLTIKEQRQLEAAASAPVKVVNKRGRVKNAVDS